MEEDDEDSDSDVDVDNGTTEAAAARLEQIKKLTSLPPRLISSGHNGLITEWDVNTLTPHKRLDSNGGAVWCLAPNPSMTILAVGCEDGMVRLFDVADGNLEFLRSLDRIDARLLSLAWSADGRFIYAGSSDSALRKYDVSTGRILHRTTVDRQKREDTLVWAVKPLADNHIVAGTSLGSLHILQGDTMTVVQSLRGVHAADILALAVDAAGTTIYSSGVDRKIVQSRRVDQHEGQENSGPLLTWVVAGERRWHSHDVRALALREDKPINALVSGGADTQLVACPSLEFPNVAQKRLPSFPPRTIVNMCSGKRMMACRFGQSVKLWKLGTASVTDADGTKARAEVAEGFKAVLEIQVSGGRNLTCSDFSHDGRWVAVADVDEVKLFSVDPDSEPVKARKAPFSLDSGAHALAFTPDSRRLVVADINGLIHIVDLAEGEVVKTFEQHVGRGGVGMLAVSEDGQWLASVDGQGVIESFNLDSLQVSLLYAARFQPVSLLRPNPMLRTHFSAPLDGPTLQLPRNRHGLPYNLPRNLGRRLRFKRILLVPTRRPPIQRLDPRLRKRPSREILEQL